jgi:hypothetical protein
MAETPKWTLEQLQQHLQAAVDLEFWTIPFYLSAMYSIKDAGDPAYQTILSVVNQEMLHVQLAANLANAYGLSPNFPVPIYQNGYIPHLDFDLDTPNPELEFPAHSSEIGPFDQARLDTMCLIEYPMWMGEEEPTPGPEYTEYGSIGEFYQSVSVGAAQLAACIRPVNQVNLFQRFYNHFKGMTITQAGVHGLPEVVNIVTGICEQGEGRTGGGKRNATKAPEPWAKHSISPRYRNTADDTDPSWTHFQKFMSLWRSGHFPATYQGNPVPGPGSAGAKAQQVLVENFTAFRTMLDALFANGHPINFAVEMDRLGGAILNCWKNGATPCFGPSLASNALGSGRTFPRLDRLNRKRGGAPKSA